MKISFIVAEIKLLIYLQTFFQFSFFFTLYLIKLFRFLPSYLIILLSINKLKAYRKKQKFKKKKDKVW